MTSSVRPHAGGNGIIRPGNESIRKEINDSYLAEVGGRLCVLVKPVFRSYFTKPELKNGRITRRQEGTVEWFDPNGNKGGSITFFQSNPSVAEMDSKKPTPKQIILKGEHGEVTLKKLEDEDIKKIAGKHPLASDLAELTKHYLRM